MKTHRIFVFSLVLLTNMAENGGSKDMAQYINECLGFCVVLDGMNSFRFDYEAQLHCAKAMRALLLFGGVDTIEENVKKRANQMLEVAGNLFKSVDELEIRTVAKEARELMYPEPIIVND